MVTIRPAKQSVWWVIRKRAAVVGRKVDVEADGITHPGELTGVSKPYEPLFGEGEAAFLAATRGQAGTYNPLPEAGQWVEEGRPYSYHGSFVIAKVSHVRSVKDPATDPRFYAATTNLDEGV